MRLCEALTSLILIPLVEVGLLIFLVAETFVLVNDFQTSLLDRGGRKGLRYCGIGYFLVRCCGNFYFKVRYCGFQSPSGVR